MRCSCLPRSPSLSTFFLHSILTSIRRSFKHITVAFHFLSVSPVSSVLPHCQYLSLHWTQPQGTPVCISRFWGSFLWLSWALGKGALFSFTLQDDRANQRPPKGLKSRIKKDQPHQLLPVSPAKTSHHVSSMPCQYYNVRSKLLPGRFVLLVPIAPQLLHFFHFTPSIFLCQDCAKSHCGRRKQPSCPSVHCWSNKKREKRKKQEKKGKQARVSLNSGPWSPTRKGRSHHAQVFPPPIYS